MSDHTPPPVNEVDKQLSRTLRGIHRFRWVTLAVVGAAMAGAIVMLAVLVTGQRSQLRDQQHELQASCSVWGLLVGLPAVATPPATRPSKVGVSFIVSSRVAYSGQRCGKLPPADPSVVRWAAYYHLPSA